MRKVFINSILILVGVFLWLALANAARFSIKKWDAKFESVLRTRLWDVGLTDKNVLTSVHEIKTDDAGEWVVHRLKVGGTDSEKLKRLKHGLEKSGATVEVLKTKDKTLFLVKRRDRVYQELTFLK